MKTKAQLATDVLRKLGVLDALETASAQDAALVEGRYDVKLFELRDMGLAYWPNTGRLVEEIPDAVHLALVSIMADEVASEFGIPLATETDHHGRPVSRATKGMRALRVHMAKPASGEPTRAIYY